MSSQNMFSGVTGCRQATRTKTDIELIKKFNPIGEVIESFAPGVTGCRVNYRTKSDQKLQKKFEPSIKENFRSLAFDNNDNLYSYKIKYVPPR